MRRALPMFLATLALSMPFEGHAAGLENRGSRASEAVFAGEAQASPQRPGRVGAGQRNRPQPAPAPRRGRVGKAPKGRENDHRGPGRIVVRPPRRAAVTPRRAPLRYPAPRYDVRRTYLGRTGVSVSFLYAAEWGEVYVDFARPVPATAYVVPAPVRTRPPVYRSRPRSIHIPPGHLPPLGLCRIWYPGRPPGHQPPSTDCDTAYWYAPPGSYVIYGG